MDCNREEALRAKQLAEKKMENKEFSAALKLAQKAQQLHPELENISQLILVCEVHLSAEKKSYGTEKDWYAILKIDPSSDEISIKKQYRKLALILHPDKNKFSGSTDAFKLIGEAQRVLLDREKRMIHDSRRKQYSNTNYVNKPVRPQHSWNPVFPQGQSGNFTRTTGNFQFQKAAQSGGSGVRLTFWTVCPFCSVRYQFYRDDVLNKMIHCQGCKKSFVAYELNVQGPNANANANANLNPTRPMNSVPQRNTIPVPIPKPTPSPVPSKPKPKPKAETRKRKKKVDESSESEHSSSSSESEEEEEGSVDGNSTESDENAPENADKPEKNRDFENNGEQPRRSARAKRNVSYNENVNVNENDFEATPSKKRDPKKPKKPKEDTFWRAEVREPVKESQTQETQNDKKADVVDLDSEPEPEPEPEPESESESGPEVYECPDPEFSDFEKDRKEDSFAPGQVWALYDTEDAMPRFYAYIRKVQTPGFNLHITWLKPGPETDDETIWLDEELPVSCGNFKRGKHDKAEDLPMFSHLVTCEGIKGIFNILPKKGETWALFKDWNMNWSNDGTGKYEYEFVEVLSDYDESVGFRVMYLEKLAGFRCLFGRKEGAELVIPGSDKYRFSHMVPSCRMSGEEREGVPKGCFELDPAGLPASVFE